MLHLISVVLYNFEPTQLTTIRTERFIETIVDVNNHIFKGHESTNIFNDLIKQAESDTMNEGLRAIIYTFITESMKNKRLVDKQGGESCHSNLVAHITDQLDNLSRLMQKVFKMPVSPNDPVYVKLIKSCCDLIYYYTYHLFDEDTAIKDICGKVCETLKEANRETFLFRSFEIPNDSLRMIIVKIFNSIQVSELNEDDFKRLWSLVGEQKNVGAGSNEIIVGTLLLIMTKIKQYDGHNSTFMDSNTLNFLEVSLELMRKNMNRPLKDDPSEQQEKDTLNACIIVFMKCLLAKDIPPGGESTANMDNITSIMKDESELNLVTDLSIDVEKTLGCKNVKCSMPV